MLQRLLSILRLSISPAHYAGAATVAAAGAGLGLFLWAGDFTDSFLLSVLASVLSLWALWAAGAAAAREDPDAALRRETRSFLPLFVFYACPILFVAPWFRAFFAAGVILAIALWLSFHHALVPKHIRRWSTQKAHTSLRPLFLIGAAYVLCFAALDVLQYLSFHVCFSDTGLLTEVMWNTLHGRPWHTNALPSAPGSVANYDHVAPILLLLLPVFRLVPSALTLMVAQTIWLASGAIPAYQIARHALPTGRFRQEAKSRIAFAIAASYLLCPMTQTANIDAAYNAFRPVVWAVPFLLWAIRFMQGERTMRMCVALALALCAGEEVGVIVAAFGVYLFFAKRWRILGGCVAGVAVVWLLASVCVVIPALRGAAPLYLGNYAEFGKTPAEIACHLFTHPVHVLRVLADGRKLEYVMHLLIPFGLLSLASPALLAVSLPTLAYNVLSAREAQFSVLFYYSAPMIPFLAGAAALGAAKLSQTGWLLRSLRWWSRTNVTPARTLRLMSCLLIVCALLSSVFYGISPISISFFSRLRHGPQAPIVTARCRMARQWGKRIPRDASLCSNNFLGTPFVCRKDFFLFPDGYRQADYVFLDIKEHERWGKPGAPPHDEVAECVGWLRRSPNHVLLAERDGLALFKRRSPASRPSAR